MTPEERKEYMREYGAKYRRAHAGKFVEFAKIYNRDNAAKVCVYKKKWYAFRKEAERFRAILL